MKKIPFQTAGKICLSIFALIAIFHLSIIVGMAFFDFTPMEYLWGGRMSTASELLRFEVVSLVIILLCIFFVAIKTQKIGLPRLYPIAHVATWVLFFMFVLNTIGNILAKSTFEKGFGIVTALLAVLMLRLALEKKRV